MLRRLNRILFALGAVLALGGPLAGIIQKERLLRQGRTMLLELTPMDPRSLLQGDYMALAYTVGNPIPSARRGVLILRDDRQGVGRLVRIDDRSPLRPGEYRVRFRMNQGLRIGGDSYFFQEGTGPAYAKARYGELRVGAGGEVVLVRLRGPNREPLGAFH